MYEFSKGKIVKKKKNTKWGITLNDLISSENENGPKVPLC